MEANILLAKCSEGRLYGIRAEKRGSDWVRTWAFKISERSAVKEGFDKTVIKGTLRAVDEYPGCPYCGGFGFITCGKCGKVSCFANETEISTCEWCGHKGKTVVTETLTVKSGQF